MLVNMFVETCKFFQDSKEQVLFATEKKKKKKASKPKNITDPSFLNTVFINSSIWSN